MTYISTIQTRFRSIFILINFKKYYIISFVLFKSFSPSTGRQIPQREQENGTVQTSQPNGGPNKNLVPKPAHQMEETAGLQAENGEQSTSGVFLSQPGGAVRPRW